MGMYTQLVFGAELKADKYSEIRPILKYMIEGEELNEIPPSHEFFRCARWDVLARCDSYYFDLKTNSRLIEDEQGIIYLNIISNLKNYDDEISKFLSWISPYLENPIGDFLGFYRYEEDENPSLIYKR